MTTPIDHALTPGRANVCRAVRWVGALHVVPMIVNEPAGQRCDAAAVKARYYRKPEGT